jgi:hypothetical protein
MHSSLKKAVLVGVFAAVVVLATASIAFAAPLIPVGWGWVDGPHGSYPGYCLNCHSGFSYGKPPAITSGVAPTHRDRGSTCTKCHVVNAPVVNAPKPKIAFVRNTGPIAYDIASLQRTTFSTKVDVTGANAVLYVATAAGNKVLYSGKLGAANTTLVFPAWNGMGIDGKRLPSAAYTWTLKVTTSGGTTTTSGKITVSKIWFQRKGVSAKGVKVAATGYMKPGSANVYVSAKTTAASDRFSLRCYRAGAFAFPTANWTFGSATPLNTTKYFRSPYVVPSAGIASFDFTGLTNVTYMVTVIQ